jgi:hypothetical protein
MSILRWHIVAIVLVAMAVGCKSKEQTAAPATSATTASIDTQTITAPSALATIERTSCFGSCPIYKVTVMDNGELIFVGKRFVERIGTYTTLLTEDDLKAIRQMAEDVGYFKLQDAYPTLVADFPKCITSVNTDGKKKSILNGENAPRDLIGFERFLDGLWKGKELEKVSDSVKY